eukprot:TRINITY_DN25457_c0_g1_i1.p1 TRINITY_DN25457_c0_g1~~TRINITY_DN25457_c0_g1_i1.p1  ORF type:complete len:938 (-),score=207.33 TRINITY_DN25457_c0_g1_i1:93-2906(-)
MEFTEAREWRSLFAEAPRGCHGRRPTRRGHRRCRLVDPEIDARLFTVEELLELSPERYPPTIPLGVTTCGGATSSTASPEQVVSRQKKHEIPRTVSVPAAMYMSGLEGSPSEKKSAEEAAIGAEEAEAESLGRRERASSGSLPSIAMADDLEVLKPKSRLKLERSEDMEPGAPSDLGCEEAGDAPGRGKSEGRHWMETEEEPSSPLFVRRPPEAYAKLECPESALTVRVRRQASREACTGSFRTAGDGRSKAAANGNRGGADLVQVRIHLPPFGSRKETQVVIKVPTTMRVAGLRDEVLRQHAGRGLKALTKHIEYEVRLYDEDEEEPDYDCPPFDQELEIGALNVKESALALCKGGSQGDSSSASESSDRSEAPRRVESSETVCFQIGAGKGTPDERKQRATSLPKCQGIGRQFSTPVASDTMKEKEVRQADPQVTFDCGDDKSPRKPSANPESLSTSMKQGLLDELAAVAAARKVTRLGTAPASYRQTDEEYASGSVVEGGAVQSASSRTPRASGPRRKVSAPEAETAAEGRVFSHRRTRSSPLAHPHRAAWEGPVVTVGGFESLVANTAAAPQADVNSVAGLLTAAAAGGGQGRNDASDGSVLGDTSGNRMRRLELLVAEGLGEQGGARSCPQAAGDGSYLQQEQGDLLVLQVRDDDTIYKVLERVAQEQGPHYGVPTENLALERLDDGFPSRLDLTMQVRHLPPHSSRLTVVRKDTAMASLLLLPRKDGQERGLQGYDSHSAAALDLSRRHTEKQFTFSEHTASIATEYFVTVARRGQQSRAFDCALVVDRLRLQHRAPRMSQTSSAPEGKEEKASHMGRRASFMFPLIRAAEKIGKHLHLAETSSYPPPEAGLFADRRICDLRAITSESGRQQAFSVLYAFSSSGGSSPEELVYEAQTPTECAEIVARLQFLLQLERRAQHAAHAEAARQQR